MIRRSCQHVARSGATVIESAVILPLTILFLCSLVVAAMGTFRYQEVAAAAREGSRWASVHGSVYQQVTGQPAATAQDVYNQGILPAAIGFDPNLLSYSVSWNPDNKPNSLVSVTVSYQWIPQFGYAGPVVLTSTSTIAMSY